MGRPLTPRKWNYPTPPGTAATLTAGAVSIASASSNAIRGQIRIAPGRHALFVRTLHEQPGRDAAALEFEALLCEAPSGPFRESRRAPIPRLGRVEPFKRDRLQTV